MLHNPQYIHQINTRTMSISSVQNKVVIVTGCSSGIGLATARLFLERQALVFGIDVGAIPQKLADEHETFTFHQTNLTESRAVNEAVSRCHQQHGRVDVLVNCAGVSDGWSSADTIHEDEWERVMAINLTVPIRLMKAVLPFMKDQKGGSIVNVASKAGVSGASAGIAYTASKHGLVGVLVLNYYCIVTYHVTGWSNEKCCMALPSRWDSVQWRSSGWRGDQHCIFRADGPIRSRRVQCVLVS
jgi:nucleoside-diphosphate-sugar epimerase